MDRAAWSYLAVIGVAAGAVCTALVSADPRRARRAGDIHASDQPGSFVNWESAHVHPVDMTPDGQRLLVVNTADNRLGVFDLVSGVPVLSFEVLVGLDPISVRARSNTEAWVVNTISDSVSVVNLSTRNVVATVRTKDEPCDVVFAGTPQRAFISCSQDNVVQVINLSQIFATPTDIFINGEDPRALAVSPDGQTVYAAIFNSGNASTILGGGLRVPSALAFPPNVVNDATGPYGGVNPPPNAGTATSPPRNPAAGAPPAVGLIVKKNSQGRWMDDNNRDWTSKVSGVQAADSGRRTGWDMPDRDVAAISTSNLSVSYVRSLMNICMALGINPATGQVTVVGTDGTNERRFEPNVRGTFVRVLLGMVNPANLSRTVKDLNPHLAPYTAQQVAQSERSKSLGDPRGIVWNPTGTRGYVTGMGSNNLIVVNSSGDRAGLSQTIPVGQGPTGIAFDASRGRLYVLNRFDASISVVNAGTETVIATVPFFDPTPVAIKSGRRHLYSTHQTSGLGQASCASCHVDGKIDRLAWDLGNPAGELKELTGQNLGAGIPGLTPGTANPGFAPWHPMKGPMTTQTFQDIIGKEPFHWRGDRAGIEEFNPAFVGLLGDDAQLTAVEVQEFEDFLATITFPPNPFRNFDNTLPLSLPLPGHFTTGRFGAAGQPLPNGNALNGLILYSSTFRMLDGGVLPCLTCHTLPTGIGPDATLNTQNFTYSQFATGPAGEHHAMLVAGDGSTNLAMKVPHLRNAYLKVGFDTTQLENNSGFGFLHDGSIDSLARFVAEPVFTVQSDQEVADLVAFMLCMSGSELPANGTNAFNPPGLPSLDTHAAVGEQTTVLDAATAPPIQTFFINLMINQAQAGKVGLVVKGIINGEQRGLVLAGPSFQSDRQSQFFSPAALLALARPGQELTYTCVPKGTESRIGVDRDLNGILDRDQADLACYVNCDGSHNPPILNILDFQCFIQRFGSGHPAANCDGSTTPPVLNAADFQCFLNRYAVGCG